MMFAPFKTSYYANVWWFLGVADTNDVMQKIEKTLNNTHTTTQKLTNNSFRNTKKHPNVYTYAGCKESQFYSLPFRLAVGSPIFG